MISVAVWCCMCEGHLLIVTVNLFTLSKQGSYSFNQSLISGWL